MEVIPAPEGVDEIMDKVMRITLALFFIILAVFIAMVAYNGYVETAYRNSFSGNYSYTCTISTDDLLSNVTFFIPVPADRDGNSPVVSAYSSHAVGGVPADWKTTLYDTGKSTMIKVEAPAIVPPTGTTASSPYTIVLSTEAASRTPIDTQKPAEKSAVFRPMQDLHERTCVISAGSTVPCLAFTTTVYADYRTAPGTRVKITSGLTGRNAWIVFEPHSNEFRSEFSLELTGEHHGWAEAGGQLISGIGSYDIPAGS